MSSKTSAIFISSSQRHATSFFLLYIHHNTIACALCSFYEYLVIVSCKYLQRHQPPKQLAR
jgi:hypothetical protein